MPVVSAVSDYAGLDEAALTALARTGDREAFRSIMTRCNQRLFRIARAMLRNEDEAEDVLQDTYLRAFAAIGEFRGDSKLFSWLAAITLNEARARLRRRRHRQVEVENIDDQSNVIALPWMEKPVTPESQAAREQTRRLVEQAVDQLPEDFRVVFVMREIEGCSVEETALQLDLLPVTVNTRLHRARRLLRKALDERLSEVLRDAFPFLGARCQSISDRVLARLPA
jgi:RNA polymerase sigma-70 factor (ECF subfamily)